MVSYFNIDSDRCKRGAVAYAGPWRQLLYEIIDGRPAEFLCSEGSPK